MDQWPTDEGASDAEAGRRGSRGNTDRDTELGRVLQTIQQLHSLTFPAEDATERMQQVDVVQDELIKQLDELNLLVQQEIDRLTENRSVASLPVTAPDAV